MGGSNNVCFPFISGTIQYQMLTNATLQIFGWFWPFSRTPDRRTGLEFEVNGFEGMCDHFTPELVEQNG